MRIFLVHLIKYFLAATLLISLPIFISNYIVSKQTFKNNETEANLFLIKENQHYNYLVLGISHARNLSRNTHHDLFEAKKGSMINLSQGNSLGGLENQYLYLDYFLSKGNKADSLLLILTPTLMYTNKIDRNSIAFFQEPIKLDFLSKIVSTKYFDYTYSQLFNYTKSKLSHHWLMTKPISNGDILDTLKGIDSIEMKKGFALAYPDSTSRRRLQVQEFILDKIITTAIENKICPVIIIPPALFGKWPGHDNLINSLKYNYRNIKILDHSTLIQNPKYYYDHHHLNTAGVKEWLIHL